ncbi:putative C6 finger domain protein [Aspergillus mulundensis]|uniref:Putative Zn(II)2Cys6 transcription factor n=1 Tax=Aspergillus mulundensis TaxID=1810919 RepID=A0A3D8SX65_9EURO|nr:putative Zn(II)2Cys6 transcription factor [Aspergillus mulundensis]RDW90896.1 putative Zn(II)2Cys6 transcription factor [Aspergillus mulundensis]
MSTSPERDREGIFDSNSSGVSNELVNKKKRSNSEATEYPRRRATIACQICRLRKTRCNGARPKCQLCTDLDAECVYREPGIKLDAGDKLIIERLTRIEGLLQTSLATQNSHFALSSTSPATSNGTNIGSDDAGAKASSHLAIPKGTSIAGLASWANPPTSISTMPRVHTTPALNLLNWPLIRELVARPYDSQTLLQLEMAREPLRMTPPVAFDLSRATAYIESFFERVNVWYACVSPYTWARYYNTAISLSFREGPESCVVLLVLALGCAAECGSIALVSTDRDPPGLSFFRAAWNILPSVMMRNSVVAAQCIIMAAAYLFYLVRPLEAWTLLSNASMKLQLLFGNPSRVPSQWRELSVRVYWNALLYESDLLAELDLPHSGIVNFEELVDLPGGFDEDEDEEYDDEDGNDETTRNKPVNPVGRDELWYFLAEIALRRLLNRVSHMLYQKDNSLTLASLAPIVSELDFQLSQWYEGLPPPVRFPLSHAPISHSVQTVLRLRYFACRTIIYRPYILAVFESEQASSDPWVRECCRRCLEATLYQLENVTTHRDGHLPYLWQGALSMVSQSLLIMGATMSPALSKILPSTLRVDGIISSVIVEVDRYAHLAPSLKLSSEILRDAERRRQICLGSSGKRA